MSRADGFTFVVPGIPPSVNHYKKPRRGGRWGMYVTEEALKFKSDLALCAKGMCVPAKRYGVEISIFLGKKQKGDLDNFSKCVLDGMVDAGVIDSDAKIVELTMRKDRDIANPRTVISVWAVQGMR